MKKKIIFVLLAASTLVGVSFTTNQNLQEDLLKDSISRGLAVYNARCLSCHQATGVGLPGVFPPLTNSDHMKTDSTSLIGIILNGQNEKYTVNGIEYSRPMRAYPLLSDREIADVLNYMGNSWGNKFETITEEQVKNQRIIPEQNDSGNVTVNP